MVKVTDHPLRYELANELHARPFPTLSAPSTAIFVALKPPENAAARDKEADLAHLVALLDRHGATHPRPGATHYSGRIGRHMLKWEQHTEFVTYTALIEGGGGRPFEPSDVTVFPAEWLGTGPGDLMTSVMVRVAEHTGDAAILKALEDWFVPESLAVSRVLDDAAVIAGDFRIDPSGNTRFAVFAPPSTGQRRLGRIVQRLCEIETYKAMSMLGFARARGIAPEIGRMETQMTDLMREMTDDRHPAEDTLTRLLQVSAELETLAAAASFRFGATGAYEAIVDQRIEALREERFEGRQTFREFMMRRYEPAMRTVKSTETRLERLADRAMRTGDLLRTRVDVERSAQNQELLASMDRRADLQLRLQRTVEGLSVVAISYYAVSLAGYLLYPFAERLDVTKEMVTAAVTLPVVALVYWLVHRIRRRLE